MTLALLSTAQHVSDINTSRLTNLMTLAFLSTAQHVSDVNTSTLAETHSLRATHDTQYRYNTYH